MSEINFDEVNSLVTGKTKELKSRLLKSIRENKIKHISSRNNFEPLTGLKTTSYSKNGVKSSIKITFKREGVFVHKGVGRGGTKGRTPKPWFNPVIEKFTDELAEELADKLVDATFNSLKIR